MSQRLSFVGREDLLELFDEALETTPRDAPRVLVFWGVGGIGKSRLIERLQGAGGDPRRIPKGVVEASVNFQEPTNLLPATALERVRARLRDQEVPFPTFDIAFATWWKNAHPNVALRQGLPVLFDTTEVAGQVLEVVEETPGLSLIAKIPKALAKAGQAANDWWTKRGRKELQRISEMKDLSEITRLLPGFFGADLAAWLEEREERRAVLLFDTHEALFTERGSMVSGESQDRWLQEWVEAMPGAVVVICGRNKVEWNDSPVVITQTQVGELSPEAAEHLLLDAGVEDADLRTALIDKSQGVPQYLELAAETYHQIRGEGGTPNPEDFDHNLPALLQRFLSYVPEAEQQALYVLSVPETFDFDLYRDLMQTFGVGMHTRQSLTRLTRFSFLSQPEPNRHAFHALVRGALANDQNTEDRREIYKFLGIRADKTLEALEPYSIGETECRALEEGVTYVWKCFGARDAGTWLNEKSAAFHHAGKWGLLGELYGRILEWIRPEVGVESLEDADLLSNLSICLQAQGRMREAEALCRWALEVKERLLGPDHWDTLTSMSNMASFLEGRGDLLEAELYYRRSLAGREYEFGKEAPETWESATKLGSLLLSEGRLDEAEPLCRQAVEGLARELSPNHPTTLSAIKNLAKLLEHQGNLAEAELTHHRVLDIREELLGPNHPNTLTSVNNLASLLKAQGKLGEAELLYRRALKGSEEVLGSEHPDTLTSISNLASLLQEQGKLGEAEPLCRRALECREEVLGPDHPATLTSVSNLACLLQEQGRLGEAEPLYRRALKGMEEVLGSDHPATLTSISNLACLLQEQGKLGEAEPLCRRALECREEMLGPNHLDTLTSLNNLASLLQAEGRLGEAEPFYRRALECREEVLGPDHLDTLSSVGNLAFLLNAQGKLDEAEPLCRRALKGREEVLGLDHLDTLTSTSNLACLLKEQGKLGEAEPLCRRTLERREEVLGSDHPNTLTSVNNLASLRLAQGKLSEAELLFQRAVEGAERTLGVDHPNTKVFRGNLQALRD